MDMMTRRRAMMGAVSGPLPEWDYVWEYTDGLPDDNGWNKTATGDGGASLITAGLKITGTSSARLYYLNADRFNVDTGVLEVVAKIVGTQSGQLIVSLGNGNGDAVQIRGQYSTGNKGIWACTAGSISGMTKLVSISSNTLYTIRLEKEPTTSRIYINGTLRYTGTAANKYGGDALNTSFGWWYANGTGNYPVFESVKLKLGRL